MYCMIRNTFLPENMIADAQFWYDSTIQHLGQDGSSDLKSESVKGAGIRVLSVRSQGNLNYGNILVGYGSSVDKAGVVQFAT